jgi:glyoxylase-like metal-dependent hydrolase (beta-lactamase superfamily II)
MAGYIAEGALLLVLVFLLTRFRPAATRKIADDLYAVRSGIVNFYALRSGDEVALFDAGLSPGIARRGLAKLGISADAVTRVYFTHSDFDHTGGHKAFPKAELVLPRDEERMIDGSTPRRGMMYNKGFSDYRAMDDGEEETFGGATVKMLAAPGHTPGSAVYLIDGRILVTGDLLRIGRDGKILPFLWLMNMDHGRNRQAVLELRDTIDSARIILSGHTGVLER